MKKRSTAASILLVLVAIAAYFLKPATAPQSSPPATPTATVSRSEARSPGFRSRAALEDHFQKHGREFGDVSMDEYLARAQALRDAPVGGAVVERVRADGVVTRYDRRSGALGAYNPDRTVRTFFRPDDGEAYFKRQAERDEGQQ